MVIIAAEDTASARIEEPTIDIGAEDGSVKAPAKTALAMKPVLRLLPHRKLLSL